MPDGKPNLSDVLGRLVELGCTAAYVKILAPNDNNKNQPYLSKSFEGLHILPHGDLTSEGEGERIRYKTSLNFAWLNDNLMPFVAPEAKLILYPQYPEVRFSGFLVGCKDAPSKLMTPRKEGYTIPPRILLIAVNERSGEVFGYLSVQGTAIFDDLDNSVQRSEKRGVLFDISSQLPATTSKQQLIKKLLEISQEGWVISKRLDKGGTVLPCQAPNCGGLTLEAELDIVPNSRSEPDFLGWEVKQHNVTSFVGLAEKLAKYKGAKITLMTPEPTAGIYVEDGVEAFIRRYGYPDKSGKVDRLNFGGKYVYGVPSRLTGVRLMTSGYHPDRGTIDGNGGIYLLYGHEKVPAAEWKFSDLLQHWSRKHAKAVYVPSMCCREPELSYRFADHVRMGEGTDFLKFLRAVHDGVVFYDPGIKLEYASTAPKVKRRSQFRILSGDLPCLYDKMTVQSLL